MDPSEAAVAGMAANRRELAREIAALRAAELPARERAKRARRAWDTAMRRHYELLDAFLVARSRAPLTSRPRAPLDPRALQAPERPAEVPESARVVEVETSVQSTW